MIFHANRAMITQTLASSAILVMLLMPSNVAPSVQQTAHFAHQMDATIVTPSSISCLTDHALLVLLFASNAQDQLRTIASSAILAFTSTTNSSSVSNVMMHAKHAPDLWTQTALIAQKATGTQLEWISLITLKYRSVVLVSTSAQNAQTMRFALFATTDSDCMAKKQTVKHANADASDALMQ